MLIPTVSMILLLRHPGGMALRRFTELWISERTTAGCWLPNLLPGDSGSLTRFPGLSDWEKVCSAPVN